VLSLAETGLNYYYLAIRNRDIRAQANADRAAGCVEVVDAWSRARSDVAKSRRQL